MALNERYIPLTLLNEYFVDKDSGLPLANGTLEFYRDQSRSTPKPVFQLSSSGGDYEYVQLPNPVSLNSVGTAQNGGGDNIAIYSYPYINDPNTNELVLDLYYIVCKNSIGVEQWTREAIPNLTPQNDPVDDGGDLSNEISNAQFSRYFLRDESTSLIVSNPNTVFPIAPNWDLVASGTGSINIERHPVSGNENIPTSPAYYLTINPVGTVANVFLRQRLSKNSGVWADTFVSGLLAAKSSGGSNDLTMKYQDSSGSLSNVTIFSAVLTAGWSIFGGSVELDASTNPQSGEDAFVDIVIELPSASTVDITSIQLTPSTSNLTADLQNYDARSANREQALMGDYYIPRLEYKPIPSLLVGWDFKTNPRQFGESGSVSGGTAEYIWDQTILQTGAGLTVNFSANSITGGLSLNHAQANIPFAVIQYLDGEEASAFLGTRLSANVNGYTRDGVNSAGRTTIQMKLFANAQNSQFGILPTSLITLAADGSISLTGVSSANGWYEISQSNLGQGLGSVQPLTDLGNISEQNDVSFHNWVIEDSTQVGNGVQGIAVVLSLLPQPSSVDYETQLDSISVVAGDVPTRPAAKSVPEVLAECEYYYEKSYDKQTVAGTVTDDDLRMVRQSTAVSGSNTVLRSNFFNLQLKNYKRASPTLTFYNPRTGMPDSVFGVLSSPTFPEFGSGNITFSTNWLSLGVNSYNITYVGQSVSNLVLTITTSALEGGIRFHYVADARLGVI